MRRIAFVPLFVLLVGHSAGAAPPPADGPKPAAGPPDPASPAAAQPAISDPKWRGKEGHGKTKWGMTTSETKKILGKVQIHETEQGKQCIQGETSGLSSITCYEFLDSRLSSVMVLFTEQRTAHSSHIADYEKLKDLLTKKYGTPNADEVVWKESLYEDDPQHRGTALALGHVVFRSEWKTPETRIRLVLGAENFKVFHAITYESLAHVDEAERRQEAQALDDL